MNLKIITNQACNLSRAVGSFIQEQSHKLHATDIEFKGLHNLVTYVDKTSEERLISELSKIIPDSQFIAEESPKIETQSETENERSRNTHTPSYPAARRGRL